MELTMRQSAVLDFIRREIDRGVSPSVRDIGRALGINSPNGVMCHIRALEAKGSIVRDDKARIRLPEGNALRRAVTELLTRMDAGQPWEMALSKLRKVYEASK